MSKEVITITRANLADSVYSLKLKSQLSKTLDHLPREDCAAVVEAMLQKIADALVDGEEVKLSSFGVFSVREKAERIGRNPKTREDARISPRRVLTFRASQVMKDAMNPKLKAD